VPSGSSSPMNVVVAELDVLRVNCLIPFVRH
jgi:hypothetical protein